MDKTKLIAALFDLDGVIFDTETHYTRFWRELAPILQPDIPDFGSIIKGQTLIQIFEKYFKDQREAQQLILDRLAEFESAMRYDYIPGIEMLIEVLQRNGVRMAVVTSSDQAKMTHVHRAHPELGQIFEHILTAEMFVRSKPAPDAYLLAAETCGTVPENCIVFEDSFHGIESGRRAGMKVVGLATTNPAEAIEGLCDLVIPDFRGFTYEQMLALLD